MSDTSIIDTRPSDSTAVDPIPLAPIARLLLTPRETAVALWISPLLWKDAQTSEASHAY